jgi:glycosyltransferase involved in cell wall biosynthesis
VTLSNGGLYFNDPVEFAAEVDYLRRHPEECKEMGRQGRMYVLDNYSWPLVLGRFERALEEILTPA